ncbi:rhomboid family intramembrane serine protease [Priestia taiwanensis]|uniref:rhomboid family intramembrane serine protease n=1 Tax=Priestia taiwanensis TaxID=1347902 RepID=UPI00166A8228|nr:rhomboid family intramembrane serine protease [Priestia taiwanensis]MBM7365231.1 membrane associated rhomboid family serine protease [Priestia taiwanensis]
MFTKIENTQSFIHLYPVVCGLVFIQTFIFLLCMLHTDFFHTLLGHNEAIARGDYWRIITPLFVHLSFHHFISNLLTLILLGPFLEGYMRRVSFLLLYICSGLAGNIATFFLQPLSYVHAGSSGALFGIFGTYFYFFYTNKVHINSREKQLFLLLVGSNIFFSFTLENINTLSHLVGIVSGSLLTPFLLPKNYKSKLHFK